MMNSMRNPSTTNLVKPRKGDVVHPLTRIRRSRYVDCYAPTEHLGPALPVKYLPSTLQLRNVAPEFKVVWWKCP